ncbi:hypothetical protein V1523DRAFT_414950 [Lipomyces doorenjongii]
MHKTDRSIGISKANTFFNILLVITIVLQLYINLVTENYYPRLVNLIVIIASAVIYVIPM